MNSDNHGKVSEWEPVRRMLRSFMGDLPELAVAFTASIRRSVPVYRAIPEDEHRVGVEGELRMRLASLTEGSALDDAALAASSELAATRAAEGIPIDALIAAYQAGDQEIWRLVVERASPDVAPLMPQLGRLMLEATSVTTEVMARAHSRATRDIDGGRITLAHQFLKLLDDPGDPAEAALAANRLGFDPSGEFVGFVWLSGDEVPGASYETASAMSSESVVLAIRAVGERRFEMVAEASNAELLVTQLTERLRGGRLGVGLPQLGLAGAASSISDARMAFEATSLKRPVLRFADHWLEAVVLAERHRVSGLLQSAVDAASSQSHLAEAVVAFAESDMSIAATAHAVHLHANSVSYRLDRWRVLTGLNPRTFGGLARSLIACRMAELER